MRNFERDQLWSVTAWAIGGILFGLVVALALVVFDGWSGTRVFAPLFFAVAAAVGAATHNRSVR